MSIHSRKLNSFCRAAYALLQTQELEGGERYAVAQRVTTLIDSRVIPEIELLDQTLSLEVRTGVVRVIAECIIPNRGNEFFDWAVARICRWLGGEDVHWKSSLDKYLQKLVRMVHESRYEELTPVLLDLSLTLGSGSQTVLLDHKSYSGPPPENCGQYRFTYAQRCE